MDKKSEAFKKSEFAKLEMVLEMQKAVLPQVAENVAKPMGQIKDVTIYGTSGNEVAGLSHNVPTVMKQTFDIVKDATGVDMTNIVMANSMDAQVNKNINLNGGVKVD
jgi:flotillin